MSFEIKDLIYYGFTTIVLLAVVYNQGFKNGITAGLIAGKIDKDEAKKGAENE